MVRSLWTLPFLGVIAFARSEPASAQSFPPDSVIRRVAARMIRAEDGVAVVIGLLPASGGRRVLVVGDDSYDGDTLFEIGSITKAFTGILLAEMAERGEVRLDQTVAELLPDGVEVPQRAGRAITLKDLATHSSGLPRMPDNFRPADPSNPYADYTADQLYQFLRGHTLVRDVGSEYEYSNLGVGLLGHALARRAGKPYETLVTERVLAPLGMVSTKITLGPQDSARLARGHNARGEPVGNWDVPTLAGAGALRSTTNDMMTLMTAAMEPPAGLLGRALQRSAVPHFTPDVGLELGLGWHISSQIDRRVIWHNGGTGGYSSFAGFDPAIRMGVVVLSNQASPVDALGLHLLDPRYPLPAEGLNRWVALRTFGLLALIVLAVLVGRRRGGKPRPRAGSVSS
jgi:CubicO group peptidase (beta-lactamase class C family)